MQKTVTTVNEKQTLGDDNVRVSITLPALRGGEKTKLEKGFSRYYGSMKTGFLRFAGGSLLAKAKNADIAFGAVLKAVISFENENAVSVYVDAAVSTDDGRRLTRLSQLWDKKSGTLVSPDALFAKHARKRLLPLIEKSIQQRAESAAVPLYSDWKDVAKHSFDKGRVYISPNGLVLFYPALALNEKNEVFPVHISANELTAVLSPHVYDMLWLCADEQRDKKEETLY